jgi:hypothetical protein
MSTAIALEYLKAALHGDEQMTQYQLEMAVDALEEAEQSRTLNHVVATVAIAERDALRADVAHWKEQHRKMSSAQGWRCYACNTVFERAAEAEAHFGRPHGGKPMPECLVALRAERDAYLDVLQAIVKEARYSVEGCDDLMELVDLAEDRISRLSPSGGLVP